MFITELPVDGYGNRTFTNLIPRVIEVKLDGEHYIVLNPNYTEFNFRQLLIDPNKFIEVDGPTRKLTEREYTQLLIKTNAEQKYILWSLARANL